MNGQSQKTASRYRAKERTLINRNSTALYLAVLKHKLNYSEDIQHNLINALKKKITFRNKFRTKLITLQDDNEQRQTERETPVSVCKVM